MGVHGLTTFLRENRRVLSRTRTFTNAFQEGINQYTPLVVDGWSLIYALYADSGLPWVYGGEYDSFAKSLQDTVNAWLLVGLEPYFVFDGPVPLAKIPTTLKRLTGVINNANIFFRTSAAARSTPSFLASNKIIPPLLFETSIDALRELQTDGARVHIIMADDEADPACVALAAALGGGLVVALDSDFTILQAEGYGGYVPIDEMVWQTNGGEEAAPTMTSKDLDGFRAVVTKPRTKRKSRGLVPPTLGSDDQELSLSLAIYHPHALASHLQLAPALLPLFSALVGNDFSNPAHVRKFFEHRSTIIERIWKVARAVSAASLSGIKKGQEQGQGRGDAVLDVIHAAVTKLLVRPDLLGSGEVDKIVDETVDAALECTIPPINASLPISLSPTTCPLHPTDDCPLALALDSSSSKFLRAYRAGDLSYRVMNAATVGIVLPKTFLEDPDQRSCANVATGTWSWIWAVLAAGGHISSPSDHSLNKLAHEIKSPAGFKSPTDDDTDSRLDDSELISVVEEFTATEPSVSSDPGGLASELAERLRGLAGSWDDFDTDTDKAEGSLKESPEKSLAQYVRRGLKLLPEPVVVGQLGDMISGALSSDVPEKWTRGDKLQVFLEGMKSNTPTLRATFETSLAQLASGPVSVSISEPIPTSIGMLIWICVLRCVVQASAESTGNGTGSGSPALVGKWKKTEARAFVDALNASTGPAQAETTPPLDVRTIQRVAQLLHGFDAGARLAEVVYLFTSENGEEAPEIEDNSSNGRETKAERNVVGQAVRMFSGRLVHASAAAGGSQVDDGLWALVCEGIDESVWAHEPDRGKAKAKGKSKDKAGGSGGKGPARPSGRSIGFGILASLESE
ncbi:hypothetical protein FRC12_023984 [Ceratobasidium sp. 428]|nr:hypothetical protein FRC12_023984 [Ceratobasidium sp. 428]